METYTPKPGTNRRKLLLRCNRMNGEFRAADLADWAERNLEWDAKTIRQELRILTEKGVLERVDRGLYQVPGNGQAPEGVREIADRVVRHDDLQARGDRFKAVTAAFRLVSEILEPLSPSERAGVAAAIRAACEVT